jgi:hypothetical protein
MRCRRSATISPMSPRRSRSGVRRCTNAEQRGLCARRQLTDLVEKQRTPRRAAHEAGLVARRAREGALHVTEELALDQRGGERTAVDRDEEALPSGEVMDRPRQDLLTGAALAEKQHRERRGTRSPPDSTRLPSSTT